MAGWIGCSRRAGHSASTMSLNLHKEQDFAQAGATKLNREIPPFATRGILLDMPVFAGNRQGRHAFNRAETKARESRE